jgi:hypothetical protein
MAASAKKELIRFNIQSLGKFSQGCQGGSGIPAFNARNIRAEQPGPFFNVTLRESFGLTQRPNSFPDIHIFIKSEMQFVVNDCRNALCLELCNTKLLDSGAGFHGHAACPYRPETGAEDCAA